MVKSYKSKKVYQRCYFTPSEGLAGFVAELRSLVFASQTKAARYFDLTHSTVARYESGQLTPMAGYMACLAQLAADWLPQEVAQEQQQQLLQEVNKALDWCYNHHKAIQNWSELLKLAQAYRTKQTKTLIVPNANSAAGKVKSHCEDGLDLSNFKGRKTELAELEGWVTNEHCRVVSLFGIGGVGKTMLLASLTRNLKGCFDFSLWQSLHNPPAVEELLGDWLESLGQASELSLAHSFEARLNLLLNCLQNSRGLLVLDGIEHILQGGEQSGQYLSGYEAYGRLFQRLAETSHQSCLLLASREKPLELASLEGKQSSVRAMLIKGLEVAEGYEVLKDKALFGELEAWQELIWLYAGNPQALKLIAVSIRELFGGDIAAFLREREFVFGEVANLLHTQFNRLSLAEQQVISWLAIELGSLTLSQLNLRVEALMSKKQLLETLIALSRRSLIETRPSLSSTIFGLSPWVVHYISQQPMTCFRSESTAAKFCQSLNTDNTLLVTQSQTYSYTRTDLKRWLIEHEIKKG